MDDALAALLDRHPATLRAVLDERYAALDDVLEGRRTAVIYPAGRMGRHAAERLARLGVDLSGFGDRDPALHGALLDGLPVLSPEDVARDHARDVVLVASTLFDSPIREDLSRRGIRDVIPVAYLNLRLPDAFQARELAGSWDAAADPANRPAIAVSSQLFADQESRRVFTAKLGYYLTLDKALLDGIRSDEPIYFDPGLLRLRDDEHVADGGAYVGDTLTAFLRCSGGRFAGYVAFEPDVANLPPLEALAAADPGRVKVVPAGLARRSSRGRLLTLQGFDSRLLADDEPGGVGVSLVSLDEHYAGQPAPTLVKLDVEGFEAEALAGGRAVIAEAMPVLAISAYHLGSDLWTIPALLAELEPGSRIYLRHYTREFDDTVCYAVPPERDVQPRQTG